VSRSWPASPLDAAQRAFDLLTCPPAPLAFDGRGFGGLPDRILPLDELKKILIGDATARAERDAVWQEVVVRARRDGPAWVVAAAGLAMPGLRRAAGRLSAGWRGDTADLDGELLAGFVDRLHSLDLDGPRVCGRLIDAGARAVKRARARVEDLDVIHVDIAWSLPPAQPWDHPDWVLARAVAAAVIDRDDHLLISATRLDDQPLHQIADHLGVNVTVAAAWRRQAEHRLAAAIADGELAGITVDAAVRRVRAARSATRCLAAKPAPPTRTARAAPADPPARSARPGAHMSDSA
jgi:transposase-like protein